jgi:hypothetical protein
MELSIKQLFRLRDVRKVSTNGYIQPGLVVASARSTLPVLLGAERQTYININNPSLMMYPFSSRPVCE